MTLTSRDAVAVIAAHREPDDIVVSTMTAMKFFYAASPNSLNVSSVPMMGGASALGLGLALACPERQVWVLDGDGSLLMQLGSLATVAGAAPRRFVHVVFDNGVWFEGGGNLAVPASGVTDFAAMAAAAGYAGSSTASTTEQLTQRLPQAIAAEGPSMVHLRIEPDTSKPWSAQNPPPAFPDNQYTRMGDEARALRAALQSA